MEYEIVLHKGYYWPKKDGLYEITSDYAQYKFNRKYFI
jgi:hypothetical protein